MNDKLKILAIAFLFMNVSANARMEYITIKVEKNLMAFSALSVASYYLFKYAWSRIYPVRKKRYCNKCLNDMAIWELVDYRKVVSHNECYICGIDNE